MNSGILGDIYFLFCIFQIFYCKHISRWGFKLFLYDFLKKIKSVLKSHFVAQFILNSLLSYVKGKLAHWNFLLHLSFWDKCQLATYIKIQFPGDALESTHIQPNLVSFIYPKSWTREIMLRTTVPRPCTILSYERECGNSH